ncbi:alpha/beta fold hydrolase [Chromobacterium haemolyticum]|uniref:Alpha/beta fold hydrolase n=1 Tax=Chromobacterium fluminis TaxID=3044269 RepID=A0ABX0L633_9NEIS|nr:alpha/beta fold hydrolase [Chromobacterium haemolyticum]NHR07267.1 alpha/beta fold hydrolase [Chromobacterium haemolyticum]
MWRRWIWNGKQWLFDWGVRQQRRWAGLKPRRRSLEQGELSWLERAAPAGAPVLVLLHGFGAEKDHWAMLARRLPKMFRLIAPDLPGHGDSMSGLDISYRVEAQADRLRAFLDVWGVEHVHLIGNSMGGAIAANFAARYPRHVASLTLLNAAGAGDSASEMAEWWRRSGENPLLGMTSADGVRAMLDWAMYQPPPVPGFAIEVTAARKAERVEVERKIFDDLLDSVDQRPLLASIQAPTLIVWGREDRILHVEDADCFAAAIAGSEKRVLEQVGHLPMMEQPRQVAELWLDFARRRVLQAGQDDAPAAIATGR